MASKEKSVEYPYMNHFFSILFCIYVVIWYLQIGYRIPLLGNIRFEFILAACLIVISIIFQKNTAFDCPLIFNILIYLAVLVTQLIFSYDFEISWEIFVDRILKFACMTYLIVVFIKGPKQLIYFLAAFLFSCIKMGQEGLWGVITGKLVWENQGVLRLHGSTPLYRHPNSFAGMAIGTIPFIINLWKITSWRIKIILITQLIFALNIILYSASRTSYIGLVFLMIYLFFKFDLKKKFLFSVVLIILLSFSFIPQQYIERFHSISTFKEAEGSSSEKRLEILSDAWAIFIDHPFGVGIRAFPTIRGDIFGRIQDTHNLYLEVATNLGIHGFIIFFMFVYKMLKLLIGMRRDITAQYDILKNNISSNNENSERRALLESHMKDLNLMSSTCSAVFLFILVRLVLGFFGMDLYEIYWWFASGLTIAIFNMKKIARARTNELLIDSKKVEKRWSP